MNIQMQVKWSKGWEKKLGIIITIIILMEVRQVQWNIRFLICCGSGAEGAGLCLNKCGD